MKKIIIALMALSVLASAQYEIFVTKTGVPNNGEKTLAYFGEYKDFSSHLAEVRKAVLSNTALVGLSASGQALAKGMVASAGSAGLNGAGIGMIIALLDPYIMSLYDDDKYFKITQKISGNKVSYTKVLLVSDKSMSADEAKQILKNY